MSNVGRWDGGFFVSRSELLHWANTTFDLRLQNLEQCANGAVYCQIIDACHPGTVAMRKVNWSARVGHESMQNYKVLQQAFDKCGVTKHIEVEKLILGKYQDNLEMFQWIKTYFDRVYTGSGYDAAGRRFSEALPEWARCDDNADHTQLTQKERSNQCTTVALRPGSGVKGKLSYLAFDRLKIEYDDLLEELVDLKVTVDCLETERDLYFQKLKDVEILCQTAEAQPDLKVALPTFVETVQRILYAKDDEDSCHQYHVTDEIEPCE